MTFLFDLTWWCVLTILLSQDMKAYCIILIRQRSASFHHLLSFSLIGVHAWIPHPPSVLLLQTRLQLSSHVCSCVHVASISSGLGFQKHTVGVRGMHISARVRDAWWLPNGLSSSRPFQQVSERTCSSSCYYFLPSIFFYFWQYNECEIISHYCFNFHFPGD